MFWKKKQTCKRCGKTIAERTGATGVDATDAPFVFKNTGETLCADCAINALGEAMPEESSPATEAFIEKTIKEISVRADVDPALFTARCKTFVPSDVEIRKAARGYDVTFFRLLMANPQQTENVVDYVVNWIREHPLEVGELTTKRIGPQQLNEGGMFVFLFIPAGRPFPDDEDITHMSNQIAPGFPPTELGWRILSQPQDVGTENHAFIADTLKNWSQEQGNAEGIKLAPKPVETKTGRKLVCLVAYRQPRS